MGESLDSTISGSLWEQSFSVSRSLKSLSFSDKFVSSSSTLFSGKKGFTQVHKNMNTFY